MPITARAAVAVAVVAALTLVLVPAALACTCGQPPPVPIALERAAMVFEGTVVAGPEEVDGGTVQYRFQVLRTWKGEPAPEVAITTAAHGPACGRTFARGSTWLLYPYLTDAGVLQENICTRSAPMAEGKRDLAELGDGTPLIARVESVEEATVAEQPEPVETPAVVEEPVAAEEPAATPEPAPEEEGDEMNKKPGCSMVAGDAAALALLLLPLAAVLRRRA